MSSERQTPDFHSVRDLLEQAWEQPAAQRLNWLQTACEDPALRAEVESLLKADAEAEEFLGAEAMARVSTLLEAGAERLDPSQRRIGRYRILEPIARGGMGAVYLGERADGAFEQRVAIKLARRFSDTPERRRRFLDEQQILARLEHPGIARLIDGGIWEGDEWSDGGRPYLVMEYADGRPITDYCREEGLDLDARLELFRSVCDAVHYAHRNLVIHRDLKPSNILVSTDGQVKLLDFGIATVLEDDADTATTRTPVMTPEYAAPEQVLGEPLTTSADVYALGLLLFELVGGDRLHRFGEATAVEIERTVCALEPTPPSRTARSRGLAWARRVEGDLDSIVLKALQREPERRYPSARALAEDVGRFLDQRPVEAQPDRWSYRLGKFLARYRWQAVAAGLGLILLVAAAVVASASALRAQRALEEARVEAAKTAQVVDFLRELFAAADPRQTGGEERSIDDVLETGTARIAELDDQPEVQALLLSELGRIHTTLGGYDLAVSELERAASLQRDLPGDPALAVTLHHLAIAEDERGNLEAAEAAAREALAVRRATLAPGHPDIGESLDRLGAVIAGQGNYEEAEPLMREAVALLQRSAGENDARTLTALHNLAWLQGRLEQYAEAEGTYREVVRLAEARYGPNDPELLVSRDSLAVALRRQGKLDEAEVIFRDVLERRRATLGEDHQAVGYTLHNLARLRVEQGELDEAVRLFEAALANWFVSLGPEHPNLGVASANFGRVLERLGRSAEAREQYHEAIRLLEPHRPGYDSWLDDALAGFARLNREGKD